MAENTPRRIVEWPDIRIPLPDGTQLAARVWMPEDATETPVPAILEYLPYRKRDGTADRDALTHPYFARAGYACLRVDIRGNGESDGLMEDEYSETELADGEDVIAWIAAQPWCSGAVGMMGISWGGFNGLQVAARAPDALKAVITLCSTVDRFADDIHYKGGCLLNENLGWGATMWSYSSRPPDPALREDWRTRWMERLEAEPFLPDTWLAHQRRDDYWRHGSVCEDYSAIKARVLAVGGWGDAYKNAVPQIVKNIPGAKGIVGPWVHKYPHFAVPEPRIGFLQEAVRWWDRWLKGIENGAENDPDYRPYLMFGVRPQTWYLDRPGLWQADPAPTLHTLHLTNAGLTDTPADLDRLVASPAHCGREAGEYCAIWLGPEMPGDQRADDALSACFDGAPLATDLDISGAPEVSLALRSDRPQAQLAVRLCHLHPDGASTRITYGVLNLSHRDNPAAPEPMPVGEPVRVTLALDHIAYRVPRGHRLRLAVSSAYWPLVWPSPTPVQLALSEGHVSLPVAPTAASEWEFPPATSAEPRETETLREANHVRREEVDKVTGTTSLIIEDDFGKRRDLDHGLVAGSVARERWSIHPDDPLSAEGACHWTQEVERGDVRLRTETYCQMHCDAESFFLSAQLEAYENDARVYEKSVTRRILRDCM